MRFPDVDSENLIGEAVSYPRDFAGARTIAIVAFDLKHRADCETWVPFIDRFARPGTARGRLFAVLPRAMRPMKGVIVATMRKGAPEAEARAATIPLFVDIDAFCASLGIADRAFIHTLVVEPDGEVSQRHPGRFNAAAGSAIEARITVPV